MNRKQIDYKVIKYASIMLTCLAIASAVGNLLDDKQIEAILSVIVGLQSVMLGQNNEYTKPE